MSDHQRIEFKHDSRTVKHWKTFVTLGIIAILGAFQALRSYGDNKEEQKAAEALAQGGLAADQKEAVKSLTIQLAAQEIGHHSDRELAVVVVNKKTGQIIATESLSQTNAPHPAAGVPSQQPALEARPGR